MYAIRSYYGAALRQRIMTVGMRNSNCLAIAPTATIANIVGVSASIEPTYQNLFVKSNLSGEFTVVNQYMVRDLKAMNLWDEVIRITSYNVCYTKLLRDQVWPLAGNHGLAQCRDRPFEIV